MRCEGSRADVVGRQSQSGGAEPADERAEVAGAGEHVRVRIGWVGAHGPGGAGISCKTPNAPASERAVPSNRDSVLRRRREAATVGWSSALRQRTRCASQEGSGRGCAVSGCHASGRVQTTAGAPAEGRPGPQPQRPREEARGQGDEGDAAELLDCGVSSPGPAGRGRRIVLRGCRPGRGLVRRVGGFAARADMESRLHRNCPSCAASEAIDSTASAALGPDLVSHATAALQLVVEARIRPSRSGAMQYGVRRRRSSAVARSFAARRRSDCCRGCIRLRRDRAINAVEFEGPYFPGTLLAGCTTPPRCVLSRPDQTLWQNRRDV